MRREIWLERAALLGLVAAIGLAYAGSFSAPFVLDDLLSVTENPSIRRLSDWQAVLQPTGSIPTGGRPLLNLSFALNYAWGGTTVAGYHALNLVIHALAALAVVGLVRRTLALPHERGDFGPRPWVWAALTALVWALQPLQTGAVTYVSQRAESLMGLFYVLTLYFFARGVVAARSTCWLALAVASCACGMATKEVMVTAPLLVLLYDRTFVSGSMAVAWRRRRGFYVGLAATWLLLAALMVSSGVRDRGIADEGSFTWWSYALTQCGVVPKYLQLAVWPHPLIFDYEIDRAALAAISVAKVLLPAALVAVLGLATLLAVRAGRWTGYCGAWIFLILAPTSSVVPITFQPMAESRMYLPLLGVVALGVFGLRTLAGRRAVPLVGAAALALMALTTQRNRVYASEERLWGDTLRKRPQNARAHNAYAMALHDRPERTEEAIAHYETALRLRPDYPDARNNLGIALLRVPSRWPEAVAHYKEVLRRRPNSAETHSNLGNLLSLLPGRLEESLGHHREAVRLAPRSAMFHHNFALALAHKPEGAAEAIAANRRAVALDPQFAQAHNALGILLAQRPDGLAEAVGHFRRAVELRPDADNLHLNLAAAVERVPGGLAEAAARYEQALRLNPINRAARSGYAGVLLKIPDRRAEGLAQLEQLVRQEPADARSHYAFAEALLATSGREGEGAAHLEIAAKLAPAWDEPRRALEKLRGAVRR